MQKTKTEPVIENKEQLLRELAEQARYGGQREENRLKQDIEAEMQKRRNASTGADGSGGFFGDGDAGGDGGGGGGGD